MPPEASFNSGGHIARQLDEIVVQEWHSPLEPPGHRHVVDALDGIVDQHDLRVQPQRGVDRGIGTRRGLVSGGEITAHVGANPILGGED